MSGPPAPKRRSRPGYTWRVFAEWSDTGMKHAYGTHQPGAYRSGAYPYGYTHYRQVLGHPAGGDATLGSLGAIVDGPRASAMLVLHSGHALAGSQLYAPGDHLRGASLGLSVPWQGLRWGASLNAFEYGAGLDGLALVIADGFAAARHAA